MEQGISAKILVGNPEYFQGFTNSARSGSFPQFQQSLTRQCCKCLSKGLCSQSTSFLTVTVSFSCFSIIDTYDLKTMYACINYLSGRKRLFSKSPLYLVDSLDYNLKKTCRTHRLIVLFNQKKKDQLFHQVLYCSP